MTEYLDPMLLGIVPPMDLGLGAPEGISPFPLKLRTHDNSHLQLARSGYLVLDVTLRRLVSFDCMRVSTYLPQ